MRRGGVSFAPPRPIVSGFELMEAATSHFQLSEDEHRKQRFRAAMRHNLTAYAFLAPILLFFLRLHGASCRLAVLSQLPA